MKTQPRTHSKLAREQIPAAAARSLATLPALAEHTQPMHESTLRRIAKRTGLQAKKHPTGWEILDPRTAPRVTLIGPGLSMRDAHRFIRDWSKGGDALRAV